MENSQSNNFITTRVNESLVSGLGINEGGIISFVGAGGKTTLMLRMAYELARTDKRILVTTTTKILPPEQTEVLDLIITKSKQDLLRRAEVGFTHSNVIVAASHHCTKTNKLIGFCPDFLDELWRSGRFRWILAEADGSARKPIKAPAPHEPVVPRETSQMLGLIGLSVLGKPLSEEHIHRVDRFKNISRLSDGERIGISAITALIGHPDGLFKSCPDTARSIAFLNQADVLPSLEAGISTAEQIFHKVSVVPDLTVLGQAGKSPAILTIYPKIHHNR
jgi:probable selenium-dependent hydroxylase accessory protein YqeC